MRGVHVTQGTFTAGMQNGCWAPWLATRVHYPSKKPSLQRLAGACG